MGKLYYLFIVQLMTLHTKEMRLAKTKAEIQAARTRHDMQKALALCPAANEDLDELAHDMLKYLPETLEVCGLSPEIQPEVLVSELKVMRDGYRKKYPHLYHSASPSLR